MRITEPPSTRDRPASPAEQRRAWRDRCLREESPVLAELRLVLRASRGAWGAIEARTGISYGTINKVAYGVTLDPAFSTVERLCLDLGIRMTRPKPRQ